MMSLPHSKLSELYLKTASYAKGFVSQKIRDRADNDFFGLEAEVLEPLALDVYDTIDRERSNRGPVA